MIREVELASVNARTSARSLIREYSGVRALGCAELSSDARSICGDLKFWPCPPHVLYLGNFKPLVPDTRVPIRLRAGL